MGNKVSLSTKSCALISRTSICIASIGISCRLSKSIGKDLSTLIGLDGLLDLSFGGIGLDYLVLSFHACSVSISALLFDEPVFLDEIHEPEIPQGVSRRRHAIR